ncbi:alpha-ketoglutarate-dependent dioxygenase alkB homolog 4 isoform X2 [Octopus bimaculoides]|uniref:Fe2OG dioxygenase domain-containing protein n=1 Tax=Octopus bimaculoides TaxID=37653 RepID=A0A0L8HRH6_OCTBM|nr:alpha-ketoglutarate-dependent dioxygenase alkB homolog 4 isoform X2 [Octopus bimaculoides]|eukprot:XP_014770078.1 PREDICTED: alpha-ketoglutarate-dependent dioxygenase alkB homolog 4-like isoform X2 [Octopus bimaculoides]
MIMYTYTPEFVVIYLYITTYLYCNKCQKAWAEQQQRKQHPDHEGASMEYPGIFLKEEFISAEEEEFLTKQIDLSPFVDSQSGRRKQDYGPKVNFKKQKVKCSAFTGLPSFSKFLVDRFASIPELSGFVPVELCNLEYEPSRGAAIDAHFDDFWIWGERLVTVNLLSDTYLSMSLETNPGIAVRVPLPRRSLIVVYGPARCQWKHAIHRQDIESRRLAMTFREPTVDFLPGGPHSDIGDQLIRTALTFQGISVAETSDR